MFCLLKPEHEFLNRVLQQVSLAKPSYQEIGMTREGGFPASGFHIDTAAIELGAGEAVFRNACNAMREWKHFGVGWVSVYPSSPSIECGVTLIVYANHVFVWSINSCRIVYVIDEQDDTKQRFGYGYGTLPVHSEQGEERFLIEWDRSTNVVSYEIFAFSRSNHLLVSAAWPVARVIQDKFRKDSLKALCHSIQASARD